MAYSRLLPLSQHSAFIERTTAEILVWVIDSPIMKNALVRDSKITHVLHHEEIKGRVSRNP
jgi:hypothetical protein